MHIYWANVVRQKNKYVLKNDMSDSFCHCYSISNITQLKYNEKKIYHSDHYHITHTPMPALFIRKHIKCT